MAATHREQAKLHAVVNYPQDTLLRTAPGLTDAEVRAHIETWYTSNTVLMALAKTMG
jgi:hypothetical protein